MPGSPCSGRLSSSRCSRRSPSGRTCARRSQTLPRGREETGAAEGSTRQREGCRASLPLSRASARQRKREELVDPSSAFRDSESGCSGAGCLQPVRPQESRGIREVQSEPKRRQILTSVELLGEGQKLEAALLEIGRLTQGPR